MGTSQLLGLPVKDRMFSLHSFAARDAALKPAPFYGSVRNRIGFEARA